MKKTYITPKSLCTELLTEGTLALSINGSLGDGWHTNKKSGWQAEDWTYDPEEEEDQFEE